MRLHNCTYEQHLLWHLFVGCQVCLARTWCLDYHLERSHLTVLYHSLIVHLFFVGSGAAVKLGHGIGGGCYP